MNRLLTTIIMFAMLFAACHAVPAEAPPEPENNHTAQEQAQEPQLAFEPAPESVEHEMFDSAEIIAQFDLVAEAAADIVDNFVLDIDAGMYPLPTREEYAALSAAIGALGFPVAGPDMLNYQQVLEFWENYSAGRDVQVTIYSLHNTGIFANVYNHSGGRLYLLRAFYRFQTAFCPDYRPGVEIQENIQRIDNLRLTENGWLVHPVANHGWNYAGFRVLPLGEENHKLARRYLWGGAVRGGILAESWDSEDFSALSLPQVFATLYHQAGGFVTDDFLVDVMIGGGSHDTAVLQVPADILEGLMLNRMPFTLEYLHEHLPYSMGEYNFELPIISGGFHIWEVVGAIQNADGSRTLSVNAIDPNTLEVWRSSTLTVTGNPDGSVRYISHEVTS